MRHALFAALLLAATAAHADLKAVSSGVTGSGIVTSSVIDTPPPPGTTELSIAPTNAIDVLIGKHVGIGRAPTQLLDVFNGGNAGTTADDALEIITSANRNARLTLDSGATNSATLLFSVSGTTNKGQLVYNGTTSVLSLDTFAATKITIGATSSGTNVQGTNTNDNAAAGVEGEYITATAAPAAVSLSTGTTANVTSASLTAGDWDCGGVVNLSFAATTSYTNLSGGASTTTAALGAQDTFFDYETSAIVPTNTKIMAWPVPQVRFSLSATTTVFLVAQATFSVSTLTAGGTLRCRRQR